MPQWTFPPLGVRSPAVLALGNVPRWVRCLLGAGGPGTRFSVRWKRLAGVTRLLRGGGRGLQDVLLELMEAH